MMNIAICDDCQRDAELLTTLCKEYAQTYQLEMNLTAVNHPQDLLLEKTDLLLLDIQMPDVNGIDIQRKLELHNGKPLIIFVTNYHDFITVSHGVNVIGFLEKPIDRDFLFEFIDKGRMLLSASTIVNFGKHECYNSGRVQWIIMESGYSKAVLDDGIKSAGIYKTIKQWEKDLAEYWFVRINKSCLVNCQHIKSVKGDKVVLHSGEVLHVSRRERKAVADYYLAYLQHHARFI